jgi:23S rRNA-/tRNA-specific pseudouridylate synthase
VKIEHKEARIVHRLDMKTSGVIAIALTKQMAQYLGRLFMSRELEKTYLALLYGIPKISRGTIRATY